MQRIYIDTSGQGATQHILNNQAAEKNPKSQGTYTQRECILSENNLELLQEIRVLRIFVWFVVSCQVTAFMTLTVDRL